MPYPTPSLQFHLSWKWLWTHQLATVCLRPHYNVQWSVESRRRDASAFTVATITMTHHEYRSPLYLSIHLKTPSYVQHRACRAHSNASPMGEASVHPSKTSRWRSVRLSSFVGLPSHSVSYGRSYISRTPFSASLACFSLAWCCEHWFVSAVEMTVDPIHQSSSLTFPCRHLMLSNVDCLEQGVNFVEQASRVFCSSPNNIPKIIIPPLWTYSFAVLEFGGWGQVGR